MKEYVRMMFDLNYNRIRLSNELEERILDLKEKGLNGKGVSSGIPEGEFLDRILVLLSEGNRDEIHRSIIILNFIINVEVLRLERGDAIQEQASGFYEVVIPRLLATLGSLEERDLKDSRVKSELWKLLSRYVEYLTRPQVSRAMRCHKRLVNSVFQHVATLDELPDEAQELLLAVMRWLCLCRCFSFESAEDSIYVNQIRKLQFSKNDRISRESSMALLINLAKLSKRVESSVQSFFESIATQILAELRDSGLDSFRIFRTGRLLELLTLFFEHSRRRGGFANLRLSSLWGTISGVLNHVKSGNAVEFLCFRALELLTAVCTHLGPDLILVNIGQIATTINNFTSNAKIIKCYGSNIAHTVENISQICPNLHLALSDTFSTTLEILKNSPNYKQTPSEISNCLLLLASLIGNPQNNPQIESIILRSIITNPNDFKLVKSLTILINKHLSKGSSDHPGFLRSVLRFLVKWTETHEFDYQIDQTILAIKNRFVKSTLSIPRHELDYKLYAHVLDKFALSANGYHSAFQESQIRESQIRESQIQESQIQESQIQESQIRESQIREDSKLAEGELIDSIRKKLRMMRKTLT